MPQITFVYADGRRQLVEVAAGNTGMDAAREHGVEGLRGECGGECLCSTCHCYVDGTWISRVAPKGEREANLIDFVWQPRAESRLSCQLVITEALDGLVLHVPEHQIGGA